MSFQVVSDRKSPQKVGKKVGIICWVRCVFKAKHTFIVKIYWLFWLEYVALFVSIKAVVKVLKHKQYAIVINI